jgi:hypothetical protein
MPYNRCQEWRIFAMHVEDHVRNYTVAQYGDSPGDQLDYWTPEQCRESMQRYLNRFNKGIRGKAEDLRDMLKIAHYACVAYNKMGGNKEALVVDKYNDLKPGDYGYDNKPK